MLITYFRRPLRKIWTISNGLCFSSRPVPSMSRYIRSDFHSHFKNQFFHSRCFSTVSKRGENEDLTIVMPHTPSTSKRSFRKADRSAISDEPDQSPTQEEEPDRNPTNLLNLITEKMGAKGVELLLPDSYLNNLDRSPLALVLKEGSNLKMTYIAEAFSLRPKFLEIPVSKWEAVLKTFGEADVSPGIVLPAVVGNPKIFELDIRELNSILVRLGTMGISGRILSAVLAKRPQVLTADIDKIHELIENMTSFFPRAKVRILIRRDPEVLFMDFEKLEAIYEYVYFNMGLESIDLYRSRKWHRLSLAIVECRHQFLVRCGAYVMPDEKKVEKAIDNPRLDLILDTEDADFHKIAGVSSLEWETFRKIYEDEEPLEDPDHLNEQFMKLNRRIAPKENEPREEWEDVSPEEMAEDEQLEKREEKRFVEKRDKKSKKGGMKGKGDRTDYQGDRGRSDEDQRKDRRSERDDTGIDQPRNRVSNRRRSNDYGGERRNVGRDENLSPIYARSLTQKEMAELNSHLNKMRADTSTGYRNLDEEEEESESDGDEDYQEYESRKMEAEKQRNSSMDEERKRNRALLIKTQFRKRGLYLASDD